MLLLHVTVTASGTLRWLAWHEPTFSELHDLMRPKPDCGTHMKAWNLVQGGKPVNMLGSDSQDFRDLGDGHGIVALG